jgi:hypothetical protein
MTLFDILIDGIPDPRRNKAYVDIDDPAYAIGVVATRFGIALERITATRRPTCTRCHGVGQELDDQERAAFEAADAMVQKEAK